MMPLDSSVRKFTWPNARALAERCAMAYTETQRTLADYHINGRLVAAPATDTEAMLIDEGDCISVAFRGSQNLRDWVQNFKAIRSHPKTDLMWTTTDAGAVASVHSGFLEDVESVSTDLIHTLATLIQPTMRDKADVPIFVTGHSKGAAECTLFALELVRQGFNVAGVYPIESPRVFNATGAHLYDTTNMRTGLALRDVTFRIVNQNDIVPRLPMWGLGCRHCGQLVFLESWGGWSLNPPLHYVLLSDVLGLYRAWRQRDLDVLVADHKIEAVQERIRNII